MDQTEIWLTKIFNDHLAGLGNSILSLAGMPAAARPWSNFICMELLVVLIIVVLFAVLRSTLSVARPGKFQQIFELIYEFIDGQANDLVGHAGHRYLAFFGMLFIFVLFANLIGLIPGFEAPTMYPYVPAGCAVATFLYYNLVGVQVNGLWKHLKHFAGPVWWIAPLMVVLRSWGIWHDPCL